MDGWKGVYLHAYTCLYHLAPIHIRSFKSNQIKPNQINHPIKTSVACISMIVFIFITLYIIPFIPSIPPPPPPPSPNLKVSNQITLNQSISTPQPILILILILIINSSSYDLYIF